MGHNLSAEARGIIERHALEYKDCGDYVVATLPCPPSDGTSISIFVGRGPAIVEFSVTNSFDYEPLYYSSDAYLEAALNGDAQAMDTVEFKRWRASQAA